VLPVNHNCADVSLDMNCSSAGWRRRSPRTRPLGRDARGTPFFSMSQPVRFGLVGFWGVGQFPRAIDCGLIRPRELAAVSHRAGQRRHARPQRRPSCGPRIVLSDYHRQMLARHGSSTSSCRGYHPSPHRTWQFVATDALKRAGCLCVARETDGAWRKSRRLPQEIIRLAHLRRASARRSRWGLRDGGISSQFGAKLKAIIQAGTLIGRGR
jgi:hypothetical protein